MLSVCSFCMRRSTIRLTLYILILIIVTVAQVVGAVLFIVKTDEVLEWAAEHISDKDSKEAFERAKQELSRDINITKYVVLGSTILTILVLLFAMFYRCSVVSKKSEYKEQMIHNDRYERMSMEIDKAQKRKNEKMQKYEQKYGINTTTAMI